MTPKTYTDENYGCNYVGVRVLMSRGNVFFFDFFSLQFILCKFVFSFSYAARLCSQALTVYFMQYLVFDMPSSESLKLPSLYSTARLGSQAFTVYFMQVCI